MKNSLFIEFIQARKKMNKLGTLIGTCITSVLAIVMLIICYQYNQSFIEVEGLEKLTYIISFPVLIILYILLFGFSLSTTISAIATMRSESRGIRIIAIIMTLLGITEITLSILLVLQIC